MNEDLENWPDGVGESDVCSASSTLHDDTMRETDQEDPIIMRKTTKALRNAKYSARFKQSVSQLNSALPMSEELRSIRKIVSETSHLTSQLEDCLSNLLAKKPGVDQGDAIYNSALFTLSHARASYARFLIDAEKNIRSPSELEQYLVDNVGGAASMFFTSLIQSCTNTKPDVCTSVTPTVAASACISSTSFITAARYKDAQVKDVTSEADTKDCFELANGLEYSSVTTACEQNGFCTPRQKDERIESSPSTPVAAARPRKHKCEVTPSTTPASVLTGNKKTPAWKTQKLYSPAGKKRLTFADATFQLSEENTTADQLHYPKTRPGTSVAHYSSCKFIPKSVQILSRSLSSSSEADICNSDTSRNIRFSQSSESMCEEPHTKRLCHSPSIKRSVTPFKFKTCSLFNKDSFLLTNGCQFCDNRTQDPKFKEKEARPFKRNLSYSELSNRDRILELRQPLTKCVKIKLASVSSNDKSRISNDVRSDNGTSVIDKTNIESISTATDICESTQQIFQDEVMYTRSDESSPHACTTPDTVYVKARNFSIQQEKVFNFLSENGEKKGSPVACCPLASTPPRYSKPISSFNSPSDFIIKSVHTNTYDSEDTSSLVNYNSQEDCKMADDLKGSVNQDLSPSLVCSTLLPLVVDINTSVEARSQMERFKNTCINLTGRLMNLIVTCNIKNNDLCSYQQMLGNLQLCSDQLLSQDLQSSISDSCVVTPSQRLRIWSPDQPISGSFESSSSQEQIVTPNQRLKINNVVLSPSGMLETSEFESFITPVGRPFVFPIGAPRKALHATSRQHPPQCRRSLARQFAEEATRAASVVDTPPDSPVGFVGNQFLEMEHGGEM
ncbi:LOW QUALITY PROTEIN: uncharacterized protein [Procambarus clarkii]|uniref:LOW QUALITY PROTEIN: uncharacterized protein n=1 Tax=Procambarus clarkii TaxID=6728 RepID=UPI0037432641